MNKTDPMWCFENYGEAAEEIDRLGSERDALQSRLDAAEADKQRWKESAEQSCQNVLAALKANRKLVSQRDGLAAENQRLREALAPFALVATVFDDDRRGATMPRTGSFMEWPRLDRVYTLTIEDLREARAALAGGKEGCDG